MNCVLCEFRNQICPSHINGIYLNFHNDVQSKMIFLLLHVRSRRHPRRTSIQSEDATTSTDRPSVRPAVTLARQFVVASSPPDDDIRRRFTLRSQRPSRAHTHRRFRDAPGGGGPSARGSAACIRLRPDGPNPRCHKPVRMSRYALVA